MFDRHIFAMATAHVGSPATSVHLVRLPPPRTVAGLRVRGIFSEALLEQSPAHQHRSPLDWTVSLAVHLAVLAGLLVLPLWFTSTIDLRQFRLTFMAAPGVPAAPPPPALSAVRARTAKAAPRSRLVTGKLTAPTFIPSSVAVLHEAPAPPDLNAGGVVGGVIGGLPGGVTGGVLGGVIGGVLGGTVPPPPPPRAKPALATRAPVRVGGQVKPPRLLYQPPFVYPELARQAKIEGDVIVDAIIDEQGNVTDARVVQGNPLLMAFALQWVLARKYEPTYLDGQPAAVELTVTIHYRLN